MCHVIFLYHTSQKLWAIWYSFLEGCGPRASFIDTTVAGDEDESHQHEDTDDHARNASPTTHTEPAFNNA